MAIAYSLYFANYRIYLYMYLKCIVSCISQETKYCGIGYTSYPTLVLGQTSKMQKWLHVSQNLQKYKL